jgi:hypothetical protein
MRKLLLNKARTETKNWIASARLHTAPVQADVRLGVWNSRARAPAKHSLHVGFGRAGRTSAAAGEGCDRAQCLPFEFAPGKLGRRGWSKSDQGARTRPTKATKAALKVIFFVGSL